MEIRRAGVAKISRGGEPPGGCGGGGGSGAAGAYSQYQPESTHATEHAALHRLACCGFV